MNDFIMVTAADMSLLSLLRANAALKRELDRAVVVSSAAVPPDVATMNSLVSYVDETSGEQRSVFLVYPEKADGSAGKVSVLASVGTALLGLSEGQAIEWDFPDGSRRRLRLLDVIYQPERMANSPSPRAP
ncbi:MAG TPA: nucleoside diphosphate kinase regulator [Burkholderiales bacterium]